MGGAGAGCRGMGGVGTTLPFVLFPLCPFSSSQLVLIRTLMPFYFLRETALSRNAMGRGPAT